MPLKKKLQSTFYDHVRRDDNHLVKSKTDFKLGENILWVKLLVLT